MDTDAIRTELDRLQLHPVNLRAAAQDDRMVTLQGSLLHYWNAPAIVDGPWLLDVLRSLPDAAGPEVVMTAVCKSQASDAKEAQ